MVTIEKIQPSLFPKLYSALLADDDPLSTEQDWRNIFDYQWDKEEDHCGYALLENEKVVGMIGMIFAKRVIDGVTRKFCNLHTWWVREDYRGRSLALLRPVLKLDEYTITHFTPCDRVRAVSKRLGFKDLSTQLKILLPYGRLAARRLSDGIQFQSSHDALDEALKGSDRKIWIDHQPYGCGHLWISDGDENCYLLYTHVVRHRLPYCHIHFISNKPMFVKYNKSVRAWLLREHRVCFAVLDSRLAGDTRLGRSFNFWSPAQGLYKSTDLAPRQIDNLYSDVVLLKLTVLPDISHEVLSRVQRWYPLARGARTHVGG